jgi:uncharacterized protein YndB with AHSA1/START domain
MNTSEQYSPGPASATIDRKEGDTWRLVLVRELRHSPEKVWQALTDPAELREWSPFDADRNLGTAGPVQLTTVDAPTPQVSQTEVTRADAPHLLEYKWGGGDVRWQLESTGEGTRLTLWASIDRRYVAMGAAGWHLCIDVMDRSLAGHPVGRIVAGDALKFEGWQRLNREYAAQFGMDPAVPSW